jgi:hypothetical protein
LKKQPNNQTNTFKPANKEKNENAINARLRNTSLLEVRVDDMPSHPCRLQGLVGLEKRKVLQLNGRRARVGELEAEKVQEMRVELIVSDDEK